MKGGDIQDRPTRQYNDIVNTDASLSKPPQSPLSGGILKVLRLRALLA